ncbi:Laccase [Rhynchospora pubera]|uniref:Laccase n=1 Tax=Rhynchospora pubera TaxID=906938 RepID=A0AAV8C481_9POAL|nr:Laccase [Rhynchospora pubera]
MFRICFYFGFVLILFYSRVFLMELLSPSMLFGIFDRAGSAKIHHYTFVIKEATYARLCNHTKTILTVNGLYPGPTVSARKGDIVYVQVINKGNKNITIHWHGVNQPRDPWSDGPEYITQCPIKSGANFTQRIQFTEEEGTLWWHAHTEFDRATVHGAIVIYPKFGTSSPFPKTHKEFTLILGDWWNANITDVYDNAMQSGCDFQISDANTINGQPGDFAPCSANDTFKVQVEQGKRYLFRVINSAMRTEFFFAIAGHNVTVVGSDASYTKPYVNEYIMITPGQTFDLLLEANQLINSSAPYRYYIYATPFFDGNVAGPRDPNTTVAILEYKIKGITPQLKPVSPSLPNFDNTSAATMFTAGLRSLASYDHPVSVPQTVDISMYITISINKKQFPTGVCAGPIGRPFAASMNNASFENPQLDILDAYYSSISGVYSTDFPDQPPFVYNFTDTDFPRQLFVVDKSTKVKVLEYNTTVEIVFQGTNILGGENHPMHLHGHRFYVVGSGFGNFNNQTDPLSYNLVDPPLMSTIGVPKNGWATIRFREANPGVWFMHCHVDRHMIWGMDAVFITKNGNSTDANILPPPADRPRC